MAKPRLVKQGNGTVHVKPRLVKDIGGGSDSSNIFLITKDTTIYQDILTAFNDNKGLLFRNSVVVDGTSYPVIYALKQTNYVLLYVHNHPQIIDVWQVNNDNTYEKTREFVLAENQAIKDYVNTQVATNGFVLNAPRQNIEDNISIYQVQKAGNIQISVGKDRSSKSAYVCLVYAKNN